MRTLLVIGGTGFVGSNLVRKLSKMGYKIYVPGENLPRWDVGEDDIVSQALMEFRDVHIDAIIHMAAIIPGSTETEDEELLWNVNYCGTQRIIKIAQELDVRNLVYISSIPVIGKPKQLPITEEHPIDCPTKYHQSKYEAEMPVIDFGGKVLRIASPVGSGKKQKTFPDIVLEKCMKNQDIVIWGNGERIQNYIDTEDIARAVDKAIKCNKSGCFLIPGFSSISNKEFIEKCITVAGSSSKIIFDTNKNGMDDEHWIISGEKAEKILGYSPCITLEESIRKMMEDYS